MKYLFAALFLAVSAVHLFACAKKKSKLASTTKGFILLSLCSFYLAAAKDPSIIFAAALVCGFLGDVLLQIPKKGMVYGGIAFGCEHILLIINNLTLISKAENAFMKTPLWALIAVPAVWLVIDVIEIVSLFKNLPGVMKICIPSYITAICVMCATSCLLCITDFWYVTALIAVGSLFFIASDTILFRSTYVKKIGHTGGFWIMLTYIAASGLICLGNALLKYLVF